MRVQRGDSIASTRKDISRVVAWTCGCGRPGSMITYVIAVMAAMSGQRILNAQTSVRSFRPMPSRSPITTYNVDTYISLAF